MKKYIISLLSGIAMLSITASAVSAKPSAHHIYLDGQPVDLAVYEIEDNNYFKLRDLAALVNGTDKQFSVDWNEYYQSIELRTDEPYELFGGELSGTTAAQEAKPSTHSVYVDGQAFHFTAYEVGGYNYFKLRDLASALDIGIGWNTAAQRVDIFTTQGYDTPSREDLLPINYLGMTMSELWDLWGSDFTYMEYWYSGNAKGIYYDDSRVPLYFYYHDTYYTSHAKGPESIMMLAFTPESFPQGSEIAPGLSVHATYTDLRAKGATFFPEDLSGEHGNSAYCSLDLSGARAFFYWDENADPYTTPAELIELSAR